MTESLHTSGHVSTDHLFQEDLPTRAESNSNCLWAFAPAVPPALDSPPSHTITRKPGWRGSCFPYWLCLLLNIRYSTQAGIHVFILGCISVVLPKTEAHWPDVLQDLKHIEKLIQSIHIDATLYTESNFDRNCSVTAMRCFLLELHVILQECKDEKIQEKVENIIILANDSLSSRGNVTEGKCKQCEELEEKNIEEFVENSMQMVQWFIAGK
ncbi:interleukin-15 [Sorex araneus]|uniref:interleukin-15 n=1 Tax=Sorex araneus TaxID=42254 RepID=UPI002433C6F7|nr:interleukin-15 [Sorex araneus]